jgi:hypothetical protein
MNQYSFPVLEDQDMMVFLNDIGFPFQPVWKKPTTPIVMDIYTNLVDIVIGVEKERIGLPDMGILQQNSMHPDVFQRGLPEFGMLLMIFQLMDACCVFNFSIKDITNPTWGRLRTIISGVINYVRFQHEFFHVFDQNVEKTAEMEKNYAKACENVAYLTQQYEQHVGSPEVLLLKQLQQQEEILEEELQNKRKKREELEESFRSHSSRLKLLSDRVGSLDETLKGLKYELDLLKAKDVTGLLHDVENLRAKVDVQESNLIQNEQDLQILREKQDFNGKYCRSLQSLISEYEDCLGTGKLYKDTDNKVAVLQTQLGNLNTQSSNLTLQKHDLEKKLTSLKEELYNSGKDQDSVMKENQQILHDLVVKKRDLELTEKQKSVEMHRLEGEMDQIRSNMEVSKGKHQILLDEAIKRIILLSNAVDNFHKKIFAAENEENDLDAQIEKNDKNIFLPQEKKQQIGNKIVQNDKSDGGSDNRHNYAYNDEYNDQNGHNFQGDSEYFDTQNDEFQLYDNSDEYTLDDQSVDENIYVSSQIINSQNNHAQNSQNHPQISSLRQNDNLDPQNPPQNPPIHSQANLQPHRRPSKHSSQNYQKQRQIYEEDLDLIDGVEKLQLDETML